MWLLKAVDTIGNCQSPVFSLGVSQHMHDITKLVKILTQLLVKVARYLKEKNMLDFEASNFNSEVSKSNSWKITAFVNATSLQREQFLTMFYTINLSPLLVTK